MLCAASKFYTLLELRNSKYCNTKLSLTYRALLFGWREKSKWKGISKTCKKLDKQSNLSLATSFQIAMHIS